MGSDYWAGLLAWLRERLVKDGMIDASDIGLLQVIDEPQRVVDAIFAHYEKRGFEPLPEEREVLLNL
jgi:predicted Rossmann-fold nucleotide-binding protein